MLGHVKLCGVFYIVNIVALGFHNSFTLNTEQYI